MRVDLIDHTGSGHDPWYAADLLIFAKNTRVTMSPSSLAEVRAWPAEKKRAELEYAVRTLPSSWEFVDYTVSIQGVTRAFTHQLVRTRTASYAQQAMQVLDVSQGAGWDYLVGPTIDQFAKGNLARQQVYKSAMERIATAYKWLVNDGVIVEDARGLLPTNVLTNILMKVNLRTACDLTRKRSSPRNQGEFVDFLERFRSRIMGAHPWAYIFLNRTADVVGAELYEMIKGLYDQEQITKLQRTDLYKLVDGLLAQAQ